jgi:hypothetical protein
LEVDVQQGNFKILRLLPQVLILFLVEKWIPTSRWETAKIGKKTEGILGVNRIAVFTWNKLKRRTLVLSECSVCSSSPLWLWLCPRKQPRWARVLPSKGWDKLIFYKSLISKHKSIPTIAVHDQVQQELILKIVLFFLEYFFCVVKRRILAIFPNFGICVIGFSKFNP